MLQRSTTIVAAATIAMGYLVSPAAATQVTLPTTAVDDRHVVILPGDASEFSGVAMSGMVDIRITTDDRMRTYRATYRGRTYTAHVDLEGPVVRLAFDPLQRRLRALSATVRVELFDYGDVNEIAYEFSSPYAKAYPNLGFALFTFDARTDVVNTVGLLATDPRVRQARLEFERPHKKPAIVTDRQDAKNPRNTGGGRYLKAHLDLSKPGFALYVEVTNTGSDLLNVTTLRADLYESVQVPSTPNPNDRDWNFIRSLDDVEVPALEVGDTFFTTEFEFDTENLSSGATYRVVLSLFDGDQPTEEDDPLEEHRTGFTLDGSNLVQHVCVEAGRVSSEGADDPLLPQQWNLRNTGDQLVYSENSPGVRGEDIQMEGVLERGNPIGSGIRVAVVDSGLEICHPDFRESIESGASYNFNARLNPSVSHHILDFDDPFYFDPFGDHGTSVAGIIAAGVDNGIGIRGVAPGVLLRGYNLLGALADRKMAELDSLGGSNFDPDSTDVDVFNMSYGVDKSENADRDMEALFSFGTRRLRSGLGAIYVKAAGNGYDTCSEHRDANSIQNEVGCWSTNSDPRQNLPYLINVGAFNADGKKSSYSSAGANLWISAPGGEDGVDRPGVLSTDQMGWDRGNNRETLDPLDDESSVNPDGDYTALMNGTSAAAPHVSGAVAMLLESSSDLTWRDVKHVLALSGRQIDPDIESVSRTIGDSGDWILRYPWTVNEAGFRYHDWYGFGALNVDGAIEVLRQYAPDSLGKFQRSGWFDAGISQVTIPDNDGNGVLVSIIVDGLPEDANIEAVVLEFTATHDASLDEIGIRLESPSGTPNMINQVGNSVLNGQVWLPGWRILSNAFYGESPNGTWRVTVFDAVEEDPGDLYMMRLRFYYGRWEDA